MVQMSDQVSNLVHLLLTCFKLHVTEHGQTIV